MIGSFLLWVWVWSLGSFLAVLGLLSSIPFNPWTDPKRTVMGWLAQMWGRGTMWVIPRVTIEARGFEHLTKGPVMMVANHNSVSDTTMLLAALPPFKFLVKSSMFFLPPIGIHLWLAGYIRGGTGAANDHARVLASCLKWFERGCHVLWFPEGTRSRDGQVQRFRSGAFYAAKQAGVKVVPVAITGLGIVSAHGRGLEPLAAALRSGKTGVRPVTRFPVHGLCSELAAEAPIDSGPDRALELLKLAAEDALADRPWAPSARRAVLLGSTKGSLHKVLAEGGSDPFAHLAAWLAERCRARGPVRAIGAACASSTAAVGAALQLIESGRCDQAVVAGVEALHAFVYSGFHALMAMSPRPAAPFDAHRQGLSMGEGAAVLVLESAGFAAMSGRKPLGWIDGFGAATDGHDQTAPHPQGEGLLQACKAALSTAGIEAAKIGRYHAHGTATVQNDQMEAAMCVRLFGPRGVPVCAAKGSTGHTLGAAGVLDLLGCLAALEARELWPITGLQELDPKLQIAGALSPKFAPLNLYVHQEVGDWPRAIDSVRPLVAAPSPA